MTRQAHGDTQSGRGRPWQETLGRMRTVMTHRALARAWLRGLPGTLPLHRTEEVPLAVCAIFKDEARHLAEWVTFHRLMGVEEFYLYDNQSTDDWRSALRPEIEAGTVDVTSWPMPRGAAQLSAYRHCIEQRRNRARWIAFIDIDEFLFSPAGRPLPEVLNAFAEHPGVVVAWRVFGTSGRTEPAEGLVTESFVMRATEQHFLSSYGKPIVDPRRTVPLIPSPHCFRHYHRWKPWKSGTPVDETGHPCEDDCDSAEILRINHYYTRSEAEAIAKWRRGTVTSMESPPLDQLLDPGLNEVRDDAILRFVPELRRRLVARSAPVSGVEGRRPGGSWSRRSA